MGYYSEVAIVIKQSAYQEFIEGIPENTDAIKDIISYGQVFKRNNGILLYWDCIKFYGSDVDKLEESLNMIGSDNYYKVHIGEEYSDADTDGDFWENPFNLVISRSIEMNV
jgi:hypothetical protein